MSKTFLPESMYDVDNNMSHNKLRFLYDSDHSVTGIVVRLDYEKELFFVSLGGDIIVPMPYTEATIYPIYDEEQKITPDIYKLVGKKIRAKIKVSEDNTIYLSRKANMIEALSVLVNSIDMIVNAVITGFSKLSAFIDIGAGITGISYAANFSSVFYKNITDIGFEIGDKIQVKISSYDESRKQFQLSRIAALPEASEHYKRNDIVTAKVFLPLGDDEGYFVCIDRKYAGIVNSPDVPLNYGDTIVAVVKSTRPKGIKLNYMHHPQN